jgi:uncharacterized metal-binding protein YceD (DUF177 family)
MIKLRVIGIEKGEYQQEWLLDGTKFFEEDYEFDGEIEVNTKVHYDGLKYKLSFDFYGELESICDISGEEFLEEIEGEYEVYFKITSTGIQFVNQEDENLFELDDNIIEIDDLVRQEMILAIPLKRISPKYKDKEFSDLHPELTKDEQKADNPAFSKLKNLNFN